MDHVGHLAHNGRVLIYDGDCAVCSRVAEWARDRLRPGMSVVPSGTVSDAELSRLGLCRADVDTAVYWVDGNGRTWRGNLAAARLLQAVGGAWAVAGHLLAVPPLRWIGRVVYPVLARYRHQLPGSSTACHAPQRV